MRKNVLKRALRSERTVFRLNDLAKLLEINETEVLKAKVNYYIKNHELYQIRRGLYAKDKKYNKFEFANLLYAPSYISFETVLLRSGIIFQFDRTIYLASYLSRIITCEKQKYNYRKIKPTILTNPIGINREQNYSIASPERAFLDTLYLKKNFHFDNLGQIDWKKVYEILPIYDNKRMDKIVESLHKREDEIKNDIRY